MYFLAGINTKQIWNIPEEKYFAPLRILFKSFVNPFIDIAVTFNDSSFNSFLFKCFSLSSNFVFFYIVSNITFSG